MSTNSFDKKYIYHHLGIPTKEVRPNERYSKAFKMYTSDADGDFRIQFHRFEPGCPLPKLIQTMPHVALQVDSLEDAIAGQKLLLGPYEPIPDYKVAIIDGGGAPIELIETTLTPSQLWGKAEKQKDLNTSGLHEKD
ncbi:hypothetical protein NG821_03525 [Prevotella cerevisiae]|uniref:Uncharacterized protein n=1 Tax=Segatella cerevisiae TaxID=2053716 RepID=A0ABT1BV03_9BACT|nr:hypothetical protein [Segatella cerevisiae]MCO6024924.1 hypothetical protein [Segatella cerevisiae]